MPVSCAPCFVLLLAPSAAVLFLILFAKNTDLISDAPILACVWCSTIPRKPFCAVFTQTHPIRTGKMVGTHSVFGFTLIQTVK